MCIRLRHLNVRPRSVEEEVDAVVTVTVRREAVPGVAVGVELRILARAHPVHLRISLNLIILLTSGLSKGIQISPLTVTPVTVTHYRARNNGLQNVINTTQAGLGRLV